MRLLASVFAAVAVLATITMAHSGHRIVWHERPVKEQFGCVTTCKSAHDFPSEYLRTQCAVCMDRIRNTVCQVCAAAWRDGRSSGEKADACEKCSHISDYDSHSSSSGSSSDEVTWIGPW